MSSLEIVYYTSYIVMVSALMFKPTRIDGKKSSAPNSERSVFIKSYRFRRNQKSGWRKTVYATHLVPGSAPDNIHRRWKKSLPRREILLSLKILTEKLPMKSIKNNTLRTCSKFVFEFLVRGSKFWP